jgi:hypothetical protein
MGHVLSERTKAGPRVSKAGSAVAAWPAVTILVLTYNRLKEVCEVIGALRDNVRYPGELRWHIADDCTPDPTYIAGIRRAFPDMRFTVTIAPTLSGWGINCNMGLQALTTQYVFQCEDDQVAHRTIDLERGVFILEHRPDVGLVRYDGLEGHRLVVLLDETPLVGGRREHFLRVDKSLSLKRRELYGYSNRPHLKHRRFHDVLGQYPEGLAIGSTEEVFARLAMGHDGPPEIAALSDGISRAFWHIGKSWQHTADDVGQHISKQELNRGRPAA